MDRMRESLFAILGDLGGCSFLDLYAGSGVVGIEAASRGAEPVVFVEKDPGKREVLARNTSFVSQDKEMHIMPVERYLRRKAGRFDYIFLDPPFAQRGTREVLWLIAEKRLLAQEGLLIVHLPRQELLADTVGAFERFDRRNYGRSVLLFYRYPATG